MLLIVFDRKLARTLLVPGLSVAIPLGSLVIVGTWSVCGLG